MVRHNLAIVAIRDPIARKGKIMGTVVRFEKQVDSLAKLRRPDLALDVQAKLQIDSSRIEQATSACEIIVGCIESLQRSLMTLDGLQCALLACEDGEPTELYTTEIKSQLSSQLASVAGILRTLGDASEEISRVSALTHQALT
ncbi:hypothetical protein JQ594_10565 [Bradyrhizobium manausense]|uniref:hypothetical protein n=1 Tax=Bradyrhizobium manausense TaxID=989370 RepID=UPI001BA6B1E0|nr:hypothetical protein [Bradyrhizobium manausense]MBR0686358.1 hypothetical protein [Bradyrhizobium manausense]